MPVSVHELTEYISWASDDYLHLALSDGTDGKITKANIVSGLTGADALDVYYVKRSNNLSDIANPALARANLNLGSVALLNQITKANIVDFSEADYATAAQGLLADSALQAGDNISELVNDAGYIPSSQKGVANGVASLNSNGKIPETQIPAIAITDTFVVESEAEMLALDAQVGDVAIRNDESRSYILQGTDPSDLASWQELKTPTTGVASVNGQTGTVVLDADDLGLGTAASADVTTSTSDTTSGRVLTVGYGGLGVPTSVPDFSTIEVGRNRNNFFTSTVASTDRPPASPNYLSGIIFGHGNTVPHETVIAVGSNDAEVGGALHLRNKVAGDWQPWRRVLDSRSLVTGNGDTTSDRIPTVGWVEANAASTDAATTSTNGLMSSTDKTKLDGIATGAEVNQNAFTTIGVAGQGNIVAGSKTDTLTLVAGTGIAITTNTATDAITIASTGTGGGSEFLTQNVRNSSYTLELSDNGKHIYHSDGTARTYTVPPNSSVAFPVGTMITIVNDASSNGGTISLAQGSGVTIIESGTGSSGSKTINRYGMVTLLKVGTDRWYVSGSGYFTV